MTQYEFTGWSRMEDMKKWKLVAPGNTTGKTRFGDTALFREGLYELGNGVYAWMVPNGSWGESNSGLVTGRGESLLIDTLWDHEYTSVMLSAMGEVTRSAPVKKLVNTHADGDHWWGNSLVQGVEIISSSAALEEMRHISPRSMVMFGMTGKVMKLAGMARAGRYFANMCRPYGFGRVKTLFPSRTFESELSVDAGGRRVDLYMAGPAHTAGDTIVHVRDAGVIFAADIIFNGSTPVMWAGPVENIIAAIDRILEMDAEVIVPGHGPVTGKDGVRMVREYWEFVSAAAKKRFTEGLPVKEAAFDIALGKDFREQPFSSWDSPERIMTNVSTVYRNLSGRDSPLSTLQYISLLKKQAELAVYSHTHPRQ